MARLARKWRWRPAQFARTDIVFLTALVAVIAIVRGLDYSTGDDVVSSSLSLVERAAPLNVWGAVFLTGGVLIASGMLFKLHPIIFLGHCLLMVVYVMLCVGVFITVASADAFDGVRTGMGFTASVWLHYYLALRMGPRPIDAADEFTTERVVSGR